MSEESEGDWEGSKTSALRYEQILMFHRIGVVHERHFQRSNLFTLSHSLGSIHQLDLYLSRTSYRPFNSPQP